MHKNKWKYAKIIKTLAIVLLIFILSIVAIIISTETISLPSSLSYEEKIEFAKNRTYSENRYDYNTDEIFANFRPINAGKLKKDTYYRGASPYLNNNRSIYVNKLLKQNNIKNFISLSETQEQIKEYTDIWPVNNYYFSCLLRNKADCDIALGFDHVDIINLEDIKQMIPSFRKITYSEEKTYIHCQIGRDRTGAYCVLLEALADASYEEIVDDYMKSFENYHYINKYDTPDEYNQIKEERIDMLLKVITGKTTTEELKNADFHKCVEKLLHKSGMSNEEINNLTEKICE